MLQWGDEAKAAFGNIKKALTDATLPFHPKQEVPTSIMTDASLCAVRAVLQQYIDSVVPDSLFFKKVEACRN